MLGGIEQYHDIRKEGLGFWGLLQVMGRQESDGGSAGGSSLGCLVGPHWAAWWVPAASCPGKSHPCPLTTTSGEEMGGGGNNPKTALTPMCEGNDG